MSGRIENWKTENVSDFQDLAGAINKKHETLMGNARLLVNVTPANRPYQP
jgi:hypothetical protein